MTEYIERDKVLEMSYCPTTLTWDNPLAEQKEVVDVDDIESMPTADVVEVKHGRYEDDYCTICGTAIPTDDKDDFIMRKEVNFCYSCGAKIIKE